MILMLGNSTIQNTMHGIYKNNDFIKVSILNTFNQNGQYRSSESHALQGERSLTIVLPKDFHCLGITKGDYLKVSVDGTQIVMEKPIYDRCEKLCFIKRLILSMYYHLMKSGFKPVPISEDGVTPTIEWS